MLAPVLRIWQDIEELKTLERRDVVSRLLPVLEWRSSLSDSLPFCKLIIIFIFCSFWSSAIAAAVKPETKTDQHVVTPTPEFLARVRIFRAPVGVCPQIDWS